MAWPGNEFEESMPNTRTQTTSRNLLLQTYICTAGLATWGVGPDVNCKGIIKLILFACMTINRVVSSHYDIMAGPFLHRIML